MNPKLIIAFVIGLFCQTAVAQTDSTQMNVDFLVLPALSYNSDLGLHYGIYGNLFFYGTPSSYPDYRHSIYLEASRYTSGQTLLLAQYDSKQLIKKHRLTGSVALQIDPMYYFYGFNGEAQLYDGYWDKDHGRAYYNTYRRYLHAGVVLQGVEFNHFRVVFGADYWNYRLESFDHRDYDSDSTLLNRYTAQDLIHSNEASGGNRIELLAGFSYDNRDKQYAPTKGRQCECYLDFSPDLFGEGYRYLKLCAHYRQFIPIGEKRRTVVAFHLAYQGSLAGEPPYFVQQHINTLFLTQTFSEGLGGMTTVRGLPQNRLIGDGYAWGNFEMRIRLMDFKLLKRKISVITNPFFDCGMITQGYRLDAMASLSENSLEELEKLTHTPQCSLGVGFKAVVNENSVFSVEIAKVFVNPTRYPVGINVGLNYIF